MARRKGDDVDGVILLDKPRGISSNRVLQQVKRVLNAKKGGHTGSLDPIATGLLPLCFGQATKTVEYFLAKDKAYQATLKLGEATDTYDCEGRVLTTKPVAIGPVDIVNAVSKFQGKLSQVPPVYSALKRNGVPLYKLARRGEVVRVEARDRQVYDLKLEFAPPDSLHLYVHCESGFYVRSLANDIGEFLGCGAHIVELRRTSIGGLTVADALTLDAFGKMASPQHALQALDTLIKELPCVTLTDQQCRALRFGQPVSLLPEQISDQILTSERCRILHHDRPVGIAHVAWDGKIIGRKLFVS